MSAAEQELEQYDLETLSLVIQCDITADQLSIICHSLTHTRPLGGAAVQIMSDSVCVSISLQDHRSAVRATAVFRLR